MASSRVLFHGGGTGYPLPLRPNSCSNQKKKPTLPRCSSPPYPPPPPPPERKHLVARRSVSAALLLLHCFSSPPDHAVAGGLFDKYMKKKKLDPLEAYVPAVLLSQEQFKDLGKSFATDYPDFDISRSLLRSGPAASLRVNIRAVAQYASDDGKGKSASVAVDECLRALEDLDSLLLRASRKDQAVSIETMRTKISIAVGALDSLLQTVPAAVLDKGRAIADAYRMPSKVEEESKPEDLDKDIKELEALL